MLYIKKLSYFIICFVSLLCSSSCNTQRVYNKGKQISVNNSFSTRTNKVLNHASSYIGTKYKYGGNNKRGIDCSGLVCVSFDKINIKTPRTSKEQSQHGIKVNKNNLQPGDLVFFNTSGRGISHTGIVHHLKKKEVFFIHASSSKGVMISSLDNKYWKKRFVKARRYIH